MKMTTNLFRQKAVNTFLVLAGLIIIFALFSPRHVFLHPRNIAALGKLFPDLGIVALGVGMLMICGESDLSIGSVLPFCAYIFARSLYAGFTPLAGFVFALLTGAAMGWLNGFITVKTRMPSFITTLGTLMFWRGVTLCMVKNDAPGNSPICTFKIIIWENTNGKPSRTLADTVAVVFPLCHYLRHSPPLSSFW